jgi:hypothetical protein
MLGHEAAAYLEDSSETGQPLYTPVPQQLQDNEQSAVSMQDWEDKNPALMETHWSSTHMPQILAGGLRRYISTLSNPPNSLESTKDVLAQFKKHVHIELKHQYTKGFNGNRDQMKPSTRFASIRDSISRKLKPPSGTSSSGKDYALLKAAFCCAPQEWKIYLEKNILPLFAPPAATPSGGQRREAQPTQVPPPETEVYERWSGKSCRT